MLGKLINLFLSGRVRSEQGKLRIFNEFWIFFDARFLADVTIVSFKYNLVPLIYLLSWINGFIVTYKLAKEYKIEKEVDKIYRVGMDFVSLIGGGLYKTHYYDFQKFTYFELDSPIPEYIKREWPNEAKKLNYVDIIFSGYMAGGGSVVHQKICQNIEIECKIANKPKCVFLTLTEEYAKEKGLHEEIEKRYKIKEILPIQNYVFENFSLEKSQEVLFKANQIISTKLLPTLKPSDEINV